MQKIDYKILDKRMRDFPLVPSTKGSAAVDLRACVDAEQRIYPRGSMMVGTGISINIKDGGFAGLILPRSGLGVKNGIVLKNLVGLIDSDYQGEIKVCLFNNSAYPFDVKPMDRIAQLLIVPVVVPHYTAVEHFEESDRGASGFGSTGVG